MEVLKLTGKELLQNGAAPKKETTREDLENVYSYMLAEEILKNALSAGILTPDETHKLTEEFADIFSVNKAGIYPDIR